MASITLPKFIVIKSNLYSYKGNAHYNEDGSVLLGEPSVFSTLVKIEAERATSNDKYVNLRFCYSNKYWQKNENDYSIVAVSNKPEEDTTKSSCTLFEAVKVDSDSNLFYLIHVQSGGRLSTDIFKKSVFVIDFFGAERLSLVDWATLVKLPEHVAFKGDNGKYLQAFWDDHEYLKFEGDDPNDVLMGNAVSLMDDGHVRIKTDHWGKFWRRSPNWIWADSTDTTANNKDTLFWPVKIDEITIALRNAGNNNFCKRLTTDGKESCLNAAASSMVTEAKLTVHELVLGRKIYNVRYLMEYARIFDEAPFLAGKHTLINDAYSEASMGVEVTYEDSKSYTFSRGFTLTAGVKTEIETGVPFIAEGKIEVSFEISGNFQWDTTTTTTTTVTASGAVPVPARTTTTIEYVGTRGTCNIPYTYTQEDQSSTGGQPTYTDQIDGIYNGVSYYNFSFQVVSTEPIPA